MPATIHGVAGRADRAPAAERPHWGQKRAAGSRVVPQPGHVVLPKAAPQLLQKRPVPRVPHAGQVVAGEVIESKVVRWW